MGGEEDTDVRQWVHRSEGTGVLSISTLAFLTCHMPSTRSLCACPLLDRSTHGLPRHGGLGSEQRRAEPRARTLRAQELSSLRFPLVVLAERQLSSPHLLPGGVESPGRRKVLVLPLTPAQGQCPPPLSLLCH